VRKFVEAVLKDEGQLTGIIGKEIGKSIKDIRQEFMELREELPLLLA